MPLLFVLAQVFGQGANSALESCKVLGQVLQEAGGDVEKVPQRCGTYNPTAAANLPHHVMHMLKPAV